ncbi:LysM peptidoglycan-binding domain-containing protein, partial [Rubrimonas sp.]|uniref:LysM peptidoglycan-binding domain-containing protein n=1 Tax=Rubrimonas sp. TaxID=2036015 RepID=UPI002FDD0258
MTAHRTAPALWSAPRRRAPLALAGLALLAGCASRPEPAPIVWRGSEPTAQSAPVQGAPIQTAPVQTAPVPAPGALSPDARGVVDYGGYSAVVARPGDTVETMAGRVGLSPSALAAYNGLPAQHSPRPGDELILPPEAEAYRAQVAAAPVETTAPAQIAAAPVATAPVASPGAVTSFDLDRIEAEVAAPARGTAPAPFLSAEPPA